MMLRFVTSGESHGQALVAWISGLPADLPVDLEFVNRELHRRQLGYGRGGRQKIEKDRVEALSGIRHGHTIGAPIAMRLENRDWPNWEKALPVEDVDGAEEAQRPLTAPRPGHADLAGALKFNFHDARYVLERASARETAARVAAGAIAKLLLREFGTDVLSHVIGVGKVRLDRAATWAEIQAVCANLESPLRCVNTATEQRMKSEVDQMLRAGDSVGGIFEVVAHNIAPGLGGDVHTGGEGRGDRHGHHERRFLWLRGAGRNPLRRHSEALPALDQPRGRAGGRHHQRRGRGRARLLEAHLDAAAAARDRRPEDQAGRQGGV